MTRTTSAHGLRTLVLCLQTGVGFSTAPAGMTYGDAQAAADNKKFIDGFLLKFPEYKEKAQESAILFNAA